MNEKKNVTVYVNGKKTGTNLSGNIHKVKLDKLINSSEVNSIIAEKIRRIRLVAQKKSK